MRSALMVVDRRTRWTSVSTADGQWLRLRELGLVRGIPCEPDDRLAAVASTDRREVSWWEELADDVAVGATSDA